MGYKLACPVWKIYRKLRRNLLTLIKLEEQLKIELPSAIEASKEGKLSLFESGFMFQAFESLEETSEDAIETLKALENTIPSTILEDSSAFKAALQKQVPTINPEIVKGLLETISRSGNGRGWFLSTQKSLSKRLDVYRRSSQLMKKEAEALDGNALSEVGRIFLANPNDSEPEPIICFILGLGWVVCAIALAFAISSHNVEDDDEEEDDE